MFIVQTIISLICNSLYGNICICTRCKGLDEFKNICEFLFTIVFGAFLYDFCRFGLVRNVPEDLFERLSFKRHSVPR